MASINPIYNRYCVQAPQCNFKGTSVSTFVDIPNSEFQSNLAFKGTEALRAYNYNLVNKNNFNIPKLEPICKISDMDKINGKKIYSSNGELLQIVDINSEYKTIYTPSIENKNIYNVEIYKDNILMKQQRFYKYFDGQYYLEVDDCINNCTTTYKCENDKLIFFLKAKHGENKEYFYRSATQEYECYDGRFKIIYDKNLKLKQVIDTFEKNYLAK